MSYRNVLFTLFTCITCILTYGAPAFAGWQQLTNGLVGGKVQSLAVDSKNTQTIYAATFGGVFKSTNSGTSWNAASSGITGTSVYTVAIDPTNSQIIYAGTNSFGVFKSINGGGNWIAVNAGFTATSAYSLVIAPGNSQIIYAATDGGVFKSTNGGEDWNAANTGLMYTYYATTVAIDPVNNQTIYAATDIAICKSTDGGDTWSEADTGLGYVTTVTSLAIDPAGSQTIYAGTDGGVYKSTNGGTSWNPAYGGSSGVAKSVSLSAVNAAMTATTYIASLAIDPRSSQTLYAGTYDGSVFRSTNGGGNWSAVTSGLTASAVNSLAIDPGNNNQTIYAGVDSGVFKSTDSGAAWIAVNTGMNANLMLSLAIDPGNSKNLYAGTYGGNLFKSSDSGVSWSSSPSGLAVSSINVIAVDPGNSQVIFAGTNGGVFKSTNSGATWSAFNTGIQIYDSLVLSFAINPTNSQTLYAGTGTGIFRSTNGGTSWSSVKTGIRASALAIDPTNSQTVYAGTFTDSIFKSTNGGTSWFAINSGLSATSVSNLAIASGNSQIIYAGTNDGVYKSTNGGASWNIFNTGLPSTAVYSLAIDPTNNQTIYAGPDGGAYKSTDGGTNWNAVNSGLTATTFVSVLAIDPGNGQTIYAGTNAGVFKSINGATDSFSVSSPAAFPPTTSGSTSAPVMITLANETTANITVSAITITGADANQFSVAVGGTTPCANLAPTVTAGSSCTVNLTFIPTSVGAKTATVQITSNDPVSPILQRSLAGTAETSYTVTATAGSGGSITPLSRTVINGTPTTFTVTADIGNSISSVSGCLGSLGGTSGTTYITAAINADCTITALFSPNQFAVSATVTGGNGSINCTNPVNYGTTSTCTITPSAGYRLLTFADNGVDKKTSTTGNSYSIANVTATHTIVATFELTPDTTLPTIAITAPATSTTATSLSEITGTAADNFSLSKVEVQIYNTTLKRYIGVDGKFTTSATWVSATSTDGWANWLLDTLYYDINSATITGAIGIYTMTARSTDTNGNFSSLAVVNFTRSTSGGGTGSTSATLVISKPEAAAGSISSNPTGLACDALCNSNAFTYAVNSTVTLTATPAPGYYFLNWSNCDTPNGAICTAIATSSHATISANFSAKKVTSLSLTPHSQSLTLNQNQAVSGRLAMTPDVSSTDLNGQMITITIKGPAGQQVLTTSTTDINGAWSLPLTVFSQKGSYFITATYAGTDKLLTATSDTATMLVAKSAGYAIILHGKITSNEGLLDHQHTTDLIRDKLKQRLFLDDNILYLKSTASSSPTEAEVQNAVTVWAKTKMNASPAPLTIIMVDHGDPGQFHIGTSAITPEELAEWMTTLDSSLSAEAKAENQIIIIGACYSGSFIQPLSRQGRIIITSADATEQSIRGTIVGLSGETKIRQGEAFIEELFARIGSGKALGEAFKQAAAAINPKIPRITNGMHSNVWDDLSQHPLIDANGDGKGSYSLDGTADGTAVATLITGDGAFNAGENAADIVAMVPTIFLQPTTTDSLIWLSANQDNRVASAWIEIRKPGTTITTGGGTGQVIIDLETIQLNHNTALGRWETTYSGFAASGKYEIYYYTKDSQTGAISPMKRSLAYKNSQTNNAPGAFILTEPSDATTQKTALFLGWQPSSDQDNNQITYTLQIAHDNTFATLVYQLEEISDTQVAIGSEANLADLSTYFWRIIAIDQFGGQSNSTQTWSFTTNNSNGLPGIIKGYLRTATGVAIAGGTITVGGASVKTQTNGGFIIMAQSGTYSISAAAAGYQTITKAAVSLSGGAVFDASMMLTATQVTAKPGDCDGVGGVTIAEVQSAINMFLGLKAVAACVDISGDKNVSIAEVQKTINSFLGL